MTDIRAKGFDSPAQQRERLAELEEDNPAEDPRALDEMPVSAERQRAALRREVADLRARLTTIRKQTDGMDGPPSRADMHPWLRVLATAATTYLLGRLVQRLRLGAPGAAAVPMIASQIDRKVVRTVMAWDKLSTYKKRRHFKQMQEPSGSTAVKASNRLRFASALSIRTALTLVAIVWHVLPAYLIALSIAGTGFGTFFYGVLRSIVPVVRPEERGELFAALFTLSYLAFGIPTLLAGMAIGVVGLTTTTLATAR